MDAIQPPSAAEVLVEQRAGPVGERLLGQLVEALVGDLDGEVRRSPSGSVVEVADLDGRARPAPAARCR